MAAYPKQLTSQLPNINRNKKIKTDTKQSHATREDSDRKINKLPAISFSCSTHHDYIRSPHIAYRWLHRSLSPGRNPQ
jgi:hypothetical protein